VMRDLFILRVHLYILRTVYMRMNRVRAGNKPKVQHFKGW